MHGVGQATISGVREVLDRLNGKNQWILWTSMREEPVIYVNGRPYVVRDADAPFRNIDYTGIDTIHIELIEQRLKVDIEREAKGFGGKILLHGIETQKLHHCCCYSIDSIADLCFLLLGCTCFNYIQHR